jgi:flagellar basal-body rod protein FlgB
MAMFDLTTTLLGHALIAEGLDERVLASNLANLDTPGYRARFVEFQTLLAQATSAEAAAAVTPQVVTSPTVYRQDGNGVDPDQEMVLLAGAGLRYEFLADELRQRYQDLKTAAGVS